MRAAADGVGAATCSAGPPRSSRGMPCASTANGTTPRSIAAATGVIAVIGVRVGGGAPPGDGASESVQLSSRTIGARNRDRVWIAMRQRR